MRTRAPPLWPDARSPGSRTRSVHTCWGLRPRRAVQALAMTRLAMLPSAQSTASATRGWCFRGSIPSLCAPLSTLHQHPHGCQRMTRGQCGSLDLHWERLALSTPCRSPGARFVTLNNHSGKTPGGKPRKRLIPVGRYNVPWSKFLNVTTPGRRMWSGQGRAGMSCRWCGARVRATTSPTPPLAR